MDAHLKETLKEKQLKEIGVLDSQLASLVERFNSEDRSVEMIIDLAHLSEYCDNKLHGFHYDNKSGEMEAETPSKRVMDGFFDNSESEDEIQEGGKNIGKHWVTKS